MERLIEVSTIDEEFEKAQVKGFVRTRMEKAGKLGMKWKRGVLSRTGKKKLSARYFKTAAELKKEKDRVYPERSHTP